MQDDEEIPDWENKDEEPSARLQRKWDKEDEIGPTRSVCPSCGQENSSEISCCVFCGAVLKQAPCPFVCALSWIKRFFTKD